MVWHSGQSPINPEWALRCTLADQVAVSFRGLPGVSARRRRRANMCRNVCSGMQKILSVWRVIEAAWRWRGISTPKPWKIARRHREEVMQTLWVYYEVETKACDQPLYSTAVCGKISRITMTAGIGTASVVQCRNMLLTPPSLAIAIR